MSKDEIIPSIADDTKPNMGRIYDYFLGGNHNFEVDRIQASVILEKNPLAPKLVRLVRWFLGEVVHRLLEDSFTQFVDFAAGLPVQDHIHQIAPPGTKVIYSDIDPVTVAYAGEIIGANPDVLYLRCDVRNPSEILESDAVRKLFDRNRKTAIGMNGITYFIDDASLKHSLAVLYEWAKPGDRLYLCDTDGSYDSADDKEVGKIYSKMDSSFSIHPIENMKNLVGQWKPVTPGYKMLEEWVNIAGTPLSFAEEEKARTGGNYYGVILEK